MSFRIVSVGHPTGPQGQSVYSVYSVTPSLRINKHQANAAIILVLPPSDIPAILQAYYLSPSRLRQGTCSPDGIRDSRCRTPSARQNVPRALHHAELVALTFNTSTLPSHSPPPPLAIYPVDIVSKIAQNGSNFCKSLLSPPPPLLRCLLVRPLECHWLKGSEIRIKKGRQEKP